MLKKFCLTTVLAIALCMASASAHTHQGAGPAEQRFMSSWANEEIERAQTLGLIPENELPNDYRVPITRAQFRAVAMNFIALQEHCSPDGLEYLVMTNLAEENEDGSIKFAFTDGNIHDSLAFYLGVVAGRGDGTFDPAGNITRQEAAVMLTRAYEVCGGNLPTEMPTLTYTDQSKISDWATEGVFALSKWGVMKGMDDGLFVPSGQYSVEQCLVTFLRLYENAPVSRKNGNVTSRFTYEQAMSRFNDIRDRYDETMNSGTGSIETNRIEGSLATFIQVESIGWHVTSQQFYFVYPDGGLFAIDFGICAATYDYLKIEDPQFTEDGKTFTCSIPLTQDQIVPGTDVFLHEAGIYDIKIDVETVRYELQRNALPIK